MHKARIIAYPNCQTLLLSGPIVDETGIPGKWDWFAL